MPRSDLWMLRIGMVIGCVSFTMPFVAVFVPVPYLHHVVTYGTVVSAVLAAFVLVRGAFPKLRGK